MDFDRPQWRYGHDVTDANTLPWAWFMCRFKFKSVGDLPTLVIHIEIEVDHARDGLIIYISFVGRGGLIMENVIGNEFRLRNRGGIL